MPRDRGRDLGGQVPREAQQRAGLGVVDAEALALGPHAVGAPGARRRSHRSPRRRTRRAARACPRRAAGAEVDGLAADADARGRDAGAARDRHRVHVHVPARDAAVAAGALEEAEGGRLDRQAPQAPRPTSITAWRTLLARMGCAWAAELAKRSRFALKLGSHSSASTRSAVVAFSSSHNRDHAGVEDGESARSASPLRAKPPWLALCVVRRRVAS